MSRFASLLFPLTLLSAGVFGATGAAWAEPITIDGPQGKLEGEFLRVPDSRDIVVIIPGSGPTDRDGNSSLGMRTDAYRLLAEGLRDAGISSLRVDKRGFYGSAAAIADPNDVTIAAYADDTRKWVARASQEATCVWLVGHSEGGLVASVAAEQRPSNLCGVVLLAAPGRRLGTLMLEQFRANPANAAIMPQVELAVADIEAGKQHDPANLPAVLRPLFTPGLQRYMIDLFAYDPAAYAARWSGPALIMQGGADVQVKPQDADLLARAMPQAQRVDLPGATHLLKQDVPGQPFATYTDPKLPLHPAVVPGIAGFIKQNTPAR